DLPDLSSGITLVSGSPADDEASAVKAPAVGTQGPGLPGRYAWAVLDEGVKARADLLSGDPAESSIQRQADLGSPARFGLEKIDGLEDYDWLRRDDHGLLLTLPTSEVVEGLPSLGRHQHDITTVHRGLATDAARGGLKKDLSLMLGQATFPPDYASRRLYDDPAGATDTPNTWWVQSRDYANLHMNPVATSAGHGLRASVPADYNPARLDPRSRLPKVNPQAPRGMLLLPVVAKVQMMFSLVTKDAHGPWAGGTDRNLATPADNYMLYMIY